MITTREELKQYCLRALGAPVLEINIDDDQLEDRIDECLDYWRLYHYDGIDKVYLKHQIKASRLTIVETNADTFTVGTIVRGQTSGASAAITTELTTHSSGNTILIRNISGTFVAGETVSNGLTTATLAVNPVTLGEVDSHYLELSDWIYGVSRVLPFSGALSSKNMFDIQYQLRLHDLYDLTSTSIIYYKQVMGHLALLDLELNGKPMFRFNRMQGRLYLDIDWNENVEPGNYVVIECYRALNPDEFSKCWNEPWLRHYVTALFKKQWAVNLKKFSGLQLPGGVTLDGQSMYNEAQQEIKDLENELILKAAPLEFFMG